MRGQLMNFSLNLLTRKILNKKKPKVFVGISGGVDSAVSALLLKQAGYNVTGVFIRTWQPDFIECTWRDERRDAIRVCAHLNIPFLECNAESEYKNLVGMQMVNDYILGLTPNPDVLCNREVKFGVFWEFAKSCGADFIATGHYAKTENGLLLRPKDNFKDQTYFLWTLNDADLKHVIFPLGNLTKSDVREIAKKNNLPNATKKDSQGVCFLGHIEIKDFLSHYTKLIKGDVLDTKGNIIGQHDGAIIYTLGQRHGFDVFKKNNNEKPYYVVYKNATHNTITVSNDYTNSPVAKREYMLLNGFFRKDFGDNIYAMYRYNGELVPITDLNEINNDKIQIIFEKPVIISPGQSIVIYSGDVVIGGGICMA